VFVPNATHWIHHDDPTRASDEVIAFFRGEPR